MTTKPRSRIRLLSVLAPFALWTLLLGGCSTLSTTAEPAPESGARYETIREPTQYATEYKDIVIPMELSLERDESMSIKTASFAGGILSFSGRVEAQSLSDFFAATMEKNGWRLVGSVKYKKILLAFTKPDQTCMVEISEPSLTTKTQVHIYVTHDIAGSGGIGEESFSGPDSFRY